MNVRATTLALAGASLAVHLTMATPVSAQTSPETYAALDSGSFSIIVKLSVQPAQRDTFLQVIKARVEESRRHPAVIDFRILATADPHVFMGYESFTSRAAFDQFATTPQSEAFLAAVKPILARDIEVVTLSPLP